MSRPMLALTLFLLGAASAQADGLRLDFNWGNTPACATGVPATIPNPPFIVTNVPPGTRVLDFRMVDLNVPSYDHGGGMVRYTGQAVIQPGAFKYRGPCPPSGRHRYAWTLAAKDNPGLFARVLATATAVRNFPQ